MGNVITRVPERAQGLKHVQVREYVRGLIDGAAPGSAAPSERELVQRFGVARMTVRQALDALVAEGLLERVPGRGTFVARRRPMAQPTLASFTEEMARRGADVSSKTLMARVETAGPGVAKALEIAVGDDVVHWHRVRLADRVPICVQHVYLAENRLPELLAGPLPSSLYDELARRDLAPTWGEDSIEAGLARPDEAAPLEVAVGSSVLRVSRRAFAGDIAVEVSRSVYRADKYTLHLPLQRAERRPRRP